MFVLGLGHKARHGKNWAAKAIIQHCAKQGLYAREFGFADALRAYCRVLGMREKDPLLLQVVGTNVFRRLDPDIWVRIGLDTVKEANPDVAVFTDCRFLNEVEGIRSLGGVMVKVSRLNADGTPWVASDRPADHPSEIALDTYDGWDAVIAVESGKTEELSAKAIDVFEGLRAQEADLRAANEPDPPCEHCGQPSVMITDRLPVEYICNECFVAIYEAR